MLNGSMLRQISQEGICVDVLGQYFRVAELGAAVRRFVMVVKSLLLVDLICMVLESRVVVYVSAKLSPNCLPRF